MADNLNDCAPAVRTVSNGGCPAIRIVGGGGGKNGVISQTQTWTQASDGGYDYTMSDQVEGTIPQANIDLFEAAGAVFNEETGYFELNGLTDISYEEMKLLYYWSIGGVPNHSRNSQFVDYSGRTTVLLKASSSFGSNIQYWFYNSAVETIGMAPGSVLYISANTNASGAFYGCNRLKQIIGELRLYPATAISDIFKNCFSLETVQITRLRANISFANSPRLSAETVLYMIQNEAATSAITITLHATAYARAIADADVQTALAAHTNVSLASA